MSKRFLFCLVLAVSALVRVAHAATPTPQVFVVTKVIIADSAAKVITIPVNAGGDSRVVVEDVPALAGQAFLSIVEPYLNKPMSLERANALAGDIKQFAVKNDRLVTVVLPFLTRDDAAAAILRLPESDVFAGVLRFAVIVSRYSDFPDIKGNRWFSSKLLREKLGVKPGDEISISRLDEAVNWANTNPFRRVQVFLFPLDSRPDLSNLVVGVQERLPVRLITSFDDSGNEILGKRHYTGALQYGNFLGLDHQVTYQYSTTDHQHIFKAHSLTYEVPLPWRHRLALTASYLTVDPTLLGGAANLHGKNVAANLRYTYPLRGGDNPFELFAALDFKQSNNDLVYGSANFPGLTDTFQLATGLSMLRRDKHGAWAFGLNLNLSPGGINSLNTDDAFQGKRPGVTFPRGRKGGRAQYAYGNFSVQRLQNLDHGWQFVSRGIAQLSTANLLGSEQLSIGGSATVRGFDERIMSGDDGFVVSNDLQTPAIHTPLKFWPKIQVPLETRFLAFYDAGQVRFTHPTNDDPPLAPLASTGLGLRMNLATAFNLTFDYGWQITRLPSYLNDTNIPTAFHGLSRNRGHVKVVLAF